MFLCWMCLRHPNRKPAWPALDQFFARGAPSPLRGSAALGSLRSPSLRLTPEGPRRMEERQFTERNLHPHTLYGTAQYGGSNGAGTVFAVNTDGTGFTTLHTFSQTYGPHYNYNSDGAYPAAGLILSGNTLYGTTGEGGTNGYGTVFTVNTNGRAFMTLHIFTGWDGNELVASLVLSGQTLYGTTLYGGANGNGTIFAVNTDGTSFTNLHAFSLSGFSDGTDPDGGLILFGNTLYGTASVCGTNGYGTLFALKH